jgi:hypothetical protein
MVCNLKHNTCWMTEVFACARIDDGEDSDGEVSSKEVSEGEQSDREGKKEEVASDDGSELIDSEVRPVLFVASSSRSC